MKILLLVKFHRLLINSLLNTSFILHLCINYFTLSKDIFFLFVRKVIKKKSFLESYFVIFLLWNSFFIIINAAKIFRFYLLVSLEVK